MYLYVWGASVMYIVTGAGSYRLNLPVGARLFQGTPGSRQIPSPTSIDAAGADGDPAEPAPARLRRSPAARWRPAGRQKGEFVRRAAIFYPFCEMDVSLPSLQKQPKAAPNLFQRGV